MHMYTLNTELVKHEYFDFCCFKCFFLVLFLNKYSKKQAIKMWSFKNLAQSTLKTVKQK